MLSNVVDTMKRAYPSDVHFTKHSEEDKQEETPMYDSNASQPEMRIAEASRSAMGGAFREGVRKMLMEALEAEVADCMEAHKARSRKAAAAWSCATASCPNAKS